MFGDKLERYGMITSIKDETSSIWRVSFVQSKFDDTFIEFIKLWRNQKRNSKFVMF